MSFCKCFFLLSTICMFSVVITPDSLQAASGGGTKFPYQAAIISPKVEVYSGPGSRFYATGTLTKDAKVTVHRHDPGGWYMITPPKGSFSLVRADYIKKETANLGLVTQNHVIVRVASSLNKHREVEQRRLMKGDRVRIIGEDKFDDRGRVHTMYRIDPPRGEFRWVKGDHLIPLDATMRKAHDLDPFATPSDGIDIEQTPKEQNTPNLKHPIAKGKEKKLASKTTIPLGKTTGTVENGPSHEEIKRDRNILQALDLNFRDMIQQDVPQWNIVDLTHDYLKLQKSTPVSAIASQIDLRLQAMERYRKLKSEYDDLIKLTSATDRKNAQLLTMQKQSQVATISSPFPESPFLTNNDAMSGLPLDSDAGFLPDLGPDPFSDQTAQAQFPPHWRSIAENNGPSTPSAGHSFNSPYQQNQNTGTKFSGAGIVRRINNPPQPGSMQSNPQYALVSPAGKFLAYLQPEPGVDLNRFLGHSIGVYGPRQNHTALRGDIISVTGLSPVRLLPR